MVYGELGEHNGVPIRRRRLAEGAFTGVADKWNHTVNTVGNEEWDVDEILATSFSPYTGSLDARDLYLEDPNLKSNCQGVFRCVKSGGEATSFAGFNTWLTLANYAKESTAVKDLMTFLN
ncbi:Fc.00g057060.m01.CDS01 [Cosmosporella sp. VM-42]